MSKKKKSEKLVKDLINSLNNDEETRGSRDSESEDDSEPGTA